MVFILRVQRVSHFIYTWKYLRKFNISLLMWVYTSLSIYNNYLTAVRRLTFFFLTIGRRIRAAAHNFLDIEVRGATIRTHLIELSVFWGFMLLAFLVCTRTVGGWCLAGFLLHTYSMIARPWPLLHRCIGLVILWLAYGFAFRYWGLLEDLPLIWNWQYLRQVFYVFEINVFYTMFIELGLLYIYSQLMPYGIELYYKCRRYFRYGKRRWLILKTKVAAYIVSIKAWWKKVVEDPDAWIQTWVDYLHDQFYAFQDLVLRLWDPVAREQVLDDFAMWRWDIWDHCRYIVLVEEPRYWAKVLRGMFGEMFQGTMLFIGDFKRLYQLVYDTVYTLHLFWEINTKDPNAPFRFLGWLYETIEPVVIFLVTNGAWCIWILLGILWKIICVVSFVAWKLFLVLCKLAYWLYIIASWLLHYFIIFLLLCSKVMYAIVVKICIWLPVILVYIIKAILGFLKVLYSIFSTIMLWVKPIWNCFIFYICEFTHAVIEWITPTLKALDAYGAALADYIKELLEHRND
jgi:hypothetical protein